MSVPLDTHLTVRPLLVYRYMFFNITPRISLFRRNSSRNDGWIGSRQEHSTSRPLPHFQWETDNASGKSICVDEGELTSA